MLAQSACSSGGFLKLGEPQEQPGACSSHDGTWGGPGAKDKRDKLLELYHAFPGIGRADRKHDREDSLSALCLAEQSLKRRGVKTLQLSSN